MNQSLYVNWPSSLVLLGELALELAQELEQAEALRGLVRLHFRNGERAADAVEKGEGAAEAARVALSAVDGVEAELLHKAIGREVHVHALRRVDNLLARGLTKPRRVVNVLAERARVEPHAVRLRRVHAEEVVLRVEVEALLELEIREGRQVLLLRERADDRRTELKTFREAGALVLRADARRENLLRARDQILRLDREVGGEEQRLLVDALRRELSLGSGRELDGRGSRGQLGRRRSGLDGGRSGDGRFQRREALEVRRRGHHGFHRRRRRLRQRLQVGRAVLGNARVVHRRGVGLDGSLRHLGEV